jgi:hypothetical protein
MPKEVLGLFASPASIPARGLDKSKKKTIIKSQQKNNKEHFL